MNVDENVPITITSHGVAEFQSVEPEETSLACSVPPPLMSNPYVDDTPTQILSRFVRIATTNMTTVSGNHNLFNATTLINNPMILQALGTFRYFRFKAVEFKIQWSAMAFMYGWFVVSSLPSCLIRNNVSLDYHLHQIGSAVDAQLCDLGNQEDVIVEAPWFQPVQWLDLLSMTTVRQTTDYINLHVVAPNPALRVSDSNNTSVATLQIFARFVDPEVAGPIRNTPLFQTQMKGSQRGVFENVRDAGTLLSGAGGFLGKLFGEGMTFGEQDSFAPSLNSSVMKTTREAMENPELKVNPMGSFYKSPSKYSLGDGALKKTSRQRKNTIRSYLETPTLVKYGTLFTTADQISIFVNQSPLRVKASNYSRLAFMGQNFRFWKGSINWELVIFANKFTSGRLNVGISYYLPSGIQASELIQDVTIMGTTRVAFNLPYLQQIPWISMNGEEVRYDDYPYIWCQWLNLPEPVGDISFTLPYVLYQKAGPDFQFRSMCNWQPSAPPTFETQLKVSELCRKELYGNNNVPYDSEIDQTFEEMARRWTFRPQAMSVGPTIDEQVYDLPREIPMPLAYFNSFADGNSFRWGGFYDSLSYYFGYFSGSTQFKLLLENDLDGDFNVVAAKLLPIKEVSSSPALSEPLNRTEDGLVVINMIDSKTLEYTASAVTSMEFVSMRTTSFGPTYSEDFLYSNGAWVQFCYPEVLTNVNVSPSGSLFVSAGQDFCLYYPLPPPPLATGGKSLWPMYNVVSPLKEKKHGTKPLSGE